VITLHAADLSPAKTRTAHDLSRFLTSSWQRRRCTIAGRPRSSLPSASATSAVKVFRSTMSRDREVLGGRVTEWPKLAIMAGPHRGVCRRASWRSGRCVGSHQVDARDVAARRDRLRATKPGVSSGSGGRRPRVGHSRCSASRRSSPPRSPKVHKLRSSALPEDEHSVPPANDRPVTGRISAGGTWDRPSSKTGTFACFTLRIDRGTLRRIWHGSQSLIIKRRRLRQRRKRRKRQ
jgi:hypothetical protein